MYFIALLIITLTHNNPTSFKVESWVLSYHGDNTVTHLRRTIHFLSLKVFKSKLKQGVQLHINLLLYMWSHI